EAPSGVALVQGWPMTRSPALNSRAEATWLSPKKSKPAQMRSAFIAEPQRIRIRRPDGGAHGVDGAVDRHHVACAAANRFGTRGHERKRPATHHHSLHGRI